MKTIYLCGGINGLNDSQAKDWRELVKKELVGFKFLDPMDRDYREIEGDHAKEIVENDLRDIDNSDIVLVNAARPSWGTAMEVFYSHSKNKFVVFFDAPEKVSPWLSYHGKNIGSIELAIKFLRELANGKIV